MHPAVLNAANEVAVDAFLNGRLAFPGIWRVVEEVLEFSSTVRHPCLEELVVADSEARQLAAAAVGKATSQA